jgi:hypothetical protein
MTGIRGSALRAVVVLSIAGLAFAAAPASARDLHVDPDAGSDDHDGVAAPLRTIRMAIYHAGPGDTIHLQPKVYREYAGFYDKRGEPGRPVTLDGHGATLEGSDPIDPAKWVEESPGLFRCDELLEFLDDAIVGRWFFLFDGAMNRMGRTFKGPSEPLKAPAELKAGEWTFVRDEGRPVEKNGRFYGAFYIRLAGGRRLADAKIAAPVRSAGVQTDGHNAHLVVRNLTATHPYNDGFNIHGHCRDVAFENIAAIECGDDGISAHGTCQYTVDGFVSVRNSTGICDTGTTVTRYDRVLIRDCFGFDLFFLDAGRHSISNSLILSSAARTLLLSGADPAGPCTLALDNVHIERVGDGPNEVRVSENTVLKGRRVTLLDLNLQATGGRVDVERCVIGGDRRKPELILWKDAAWAARENRYDLASLRVDQTFYTRETFGDFRSRTGQDEQSEWRPVHADRPAGPGVGADRAALEKSVERRRMD